MTENTRATIASLIELDEPEALVATLGLMCQRKSEDKLTSEADRARWAKTAKRLADIAHDDEPAVVDKTPQAA